MTAIEILIDYGKEILKRRRDENLRVVIEEAERELDSYRAPGTLDLKELDRRVAAKLAELDEE